MRRKINELKVMGERVFGDEEGRSADGGCRRVLGNA
jgi:hypothetical protein